MLTARQTAVHMFPLVDSVLMSVHREVIQAAGVL